LSRASGFGVVDLSGRSLGHFRIESKLGEGGMGVVYRAVDSRSGQAVALKVLAPRHVQDPDRRRRFFREARVAAAVVHANVAAIYEVGEADGQVFIAMELVRGDTLRVHLGRGRLPIADAVLFALGAARGLAKAHEKGIVHRDLKPENIAVTWTRDLKVLDFGLAKLHEGEGSLVYDEETASNMTLEGKVTGTPGYMAPEQVTGKEVSFRTDVFTLGVLFYEMLTGEHPFRGESVMDVLIASTRDAPAPVRSRREGVTPQIEAIVVRCLAKKPADRYANAGEVVRALEALEGSSVPGVETLREGPAAPRLDGLATGPRRRRTVMVGGVVAVFAAGLAVATVTTANRFAVEVPAASVSPPPLVDAVPLAPASAAPRPEEGEGPHDAGPSAAAPLPPPPQAPHPRARVGPPKVAPPAPVVSASAPAPTSSSQPPAPPAKPVERGSANVPIVE
jgi:predicted Ser/Thr protein kinase